MRQAEGRVRAGPRLPRLRTAGHRSAGDEGAITALDRTLAWTAHLITASGAVFGLLAIFAILRHEWLMAFVWMAATLAVDSVDGTLARLWQVRRVLPRFDGALLDNQVDFLTYVIVPAILVYEAALLPAGLEAFGAATIVLASAYQFCQADAKTEDNYFRGFPSYWNAVVFYLFLLELPAWINLALVLLLVVLVFIPFHYAYPSRMPHYRAPTLAVTVLWGVACLVMMAQFPDPHPVLLWGSLLYIPYYVAISVLSRRRGRRAAASG